jgi:hypothetical protein
MVSGKTKGISCIASTKRDLPGHSHRFEFVKQIEESGLSIDVFGRGRVNPLPRGKLSGLLPYRFSIAIENTAHPDYFTEKILDCWLTGAVPIYFGAINLEEYFPKESFIRLDSLNFDDFSRRVKSGEFSEENYAARADAVSLAREIVIDKYSMHSLINSVIDRGMLNKPFVHESRVVISDLDSYSHALRDWAARRLKRG